MEYTLAKKLLDAGFPLTTKVAYVGKSEKTMIKMNISRDKDNDGYRNLLSAGYNIVPDPDLLELIEACISITKEGDTRFVLGQMQKGWEASIVYWDIDSGMELSLNTGDGNVPDEATANLWLELNKSKN